MIHILGENMEKHAFAEKGIVGVGGHALDFRDDRGPVTLVELPKFRQRADDCAE
jgi:hypothetical protein